MGCGASAAPNVAGAVEVPVTSEPSEPAASAGKCVTGKRMTFEDLMDTEVGLPDFIKWFNKDTARCTSAGKAVLKEVCQGASAQQTKTLGQLLSAALAEKLLDEKIDEKLTHLDAGWSHVAKAEDEDGGMKKKYSTVTEFFDEETACLAQVEIRLSPTLL
jgi:hypothetical protein